MPKEMNGDLTKKCFVIMPISEIKEYEDNHFKKVYDQIFAPAIIKAGYTPHRADDVKGSHLIHETIIKELIDAPMALCDLSTRNPNVLYELGIRHAFNKPVVLVQEIGTERIFDINGINTIEYRQTRLYDEVLADIDKIRNAIDETTKDKTGKHSLVKLIQVAAADINVEGVTGEYKLNVILDSIMGELKDIRQQLNTESRGRVASDSNKLAPSELKILTEYIKENDSLEDSRYIYDLIRFSNSKEQIKQVIDNIKKKDNLSKECYIKSNKINFNNTIDEYPR